MGLNGFVRSRRVGLKLVFTVQERIFRINYLNPDRLYGVLFVYVSGNSFSVSETASPLLHLRNQPTPTRLIRPESQIIERGQKNKRTCFISAA